MGRKQESKEIRDSIKTNNMTKIVLLGSAGCGKSRVLSSLTDEKEVESGYTPTNGTRNIKLKTGEREVGVVEVGGSLSKFWPRAIDSKVDGVWYVLSSSEYEGNDFARLIDFLASVRESLNTRSIVVLVTVLGSSGLSAETAGEVIAPLGSSSGVILPLRVSVCRDFERTSIIDSLKPLSQI
jgi:ABC-type cobalamin/Fe3+-siderophores transport system ATPase subunit